MCRSVFLSLSALVSMSITAIAQDSPHSEQPERINGFSLADRYGEEIRRRSQSPERLEVRKQIEQDYKRLIEQFYAKYPDPVLQQSPIAAVTTPTGIGEVVSVEVQKPVIGGLPDELQSQSARQELAERYVTPAGDEVPQTTKLNAEQPQSSTVMQRLEQLERKLNDVSRRIRVLEQRYTEQRGAPPVGSEP